MLDRLGDCTLVPVGHAQPRVGHGETGIEPQRLLVEGRSLGKIPSHAMLFFAQRKCMEGLQRSRGHVGVRRGELLDRCHRLAQPRSHRRGRFRNCCQDRRLVRCGLLLPRKNFSCGAIHRVDRNDVGRSQAGDGSREVGFHAQPLAQLLRQFWRNPLLARLSQILQVVVQFRIAHQLQQRRLLELNGQSFFQSRIENRVARLIGEVGKNQLVFVGQLHGLTLAPVESARNHRQQKDHCGGNHELAPAPLRFRLPQGRLLLHLTKPKQRLAPNHLFCALRQMSIPPSPGQRRMLHPTTNSPTSFDRTPNPASDAAAPT